MALKDLIQKVRFQLDRRSASEVEKDTTKALSGVGRATATLKKAFVGLAATIGVAFAVRKVTQFGAELIRVAKEADAIWNRVAHAVESVGLSFADVRPEIEAFARAMQDVTTVGDEQFAEVMTELITTSGDYALSLQNVSTVADLAAAKQIDLRTAAQLVGRALVGETGTFKRYGIIIKEGETAMEALRRQFGGFAANEAKSVQGRLAQLNNEWDDFKQALGEVILESANAGEGIATLRDAVKSLTEWVNANQEAFIAIGGAIRDAVGPVFITLIELYAKLTRAIFVAASAQERFLGGLRKLDGVFFGIRVGPESEGMKGRLEALGKWADALDDMVARLRRGPSNVVLPPPMISGGGGGVSPSGVPTAEGEDIEKTQTLLDIWKQYPAVMLQIAQNAERWNQTKEGWANLNSEMEISAESAAKLAENLKDVAEVGELSQTELMLVAKAGELAGGIISGVFGGNIGQVAKWKAQQNAIMAAEQFAMGVAASAIPFLQAEAAGHFAAGKLFLGVAAAWSALAGATGGFGGGGGSGASGGPRDVGGAASERAGPPGPEVHIYLTGEFDILNPKLQRAVVGATRTAEETYGPNTNVTLHRRMGR